MIEAPAPGLTRMLDVWDVDPVHSSVRFDVRHALTRLRGRFGDVWGVLVVAGPPERSTGYVEIAAASIDTDRRDATRSCAARPSCTPTASRIWCSAATPSGGSADAATGWTAS